MAWITGSTVRAALVLGAALATGLAPATASAGDWEKREMRAPAADTAGEGGAGGEDATLRDARGEVKARETKRKRIMDVRVEGLDPRRSYTVRSGSDDRDMGSLRTNRRGKGRTRITERADGAAQGLDTGTRPDGGPVGGGDCNLWFGTTDGVPCDGGDWEDPGDWDGEWNDDGSDDGNDFDTWTCIQVFDEETGECVLSCEGDGTGHDGGPIDWGSIESGFEMYEAEGGWTGFASMFRTEFGEEIYEDFALSAMRFDEENLTFDYWDYYATGDTGLPLGVASVTELEGRKFEARTAEGDVVLSGRLPSLESMGGFPYYGPTDGQVRKDDGSNGGTPDDWFYGPPEEWLDGTLVLHIENEDGEMEEVGSFVHYPTQEIIIWDGDECPPGDDGTRDDPADGGGNSFGGIR